MYLRPRSLDEACRALAVHGGRILSGGTDFYPALGDRPPAEPVIDISRVDGLGAIEIAPDHVRIGARATWSAVLRAPLPPSFAALKAAAREIGAVQIQNAGTVGGNLCNASPAADGVPPLLILDAEVELASASGVRRLPLAQFITGNRRTARSTGEVLAAIIVPRELDEGRSAFLKLGARRYLVISIAMASALVAVDSSGRVAEARIAVGACSVVAERLFALEQELAGAPAGPGLGALVEARHLETLSPIDDGRATAAYRRDAALTLVRRALDACVAER